MTKINTLKNSRQFRNVYDNGKSFSTKFLVIFYRPNGYPYNRVGISTTKKLGNSVTRNRIKRLIKENYRKNLDTIKTGYDIIFLARVRASRADFKDIEKSMSYLLKKTNINECDR
ncbi:ribonuclease P protein component [Clostridiaceae bacterium M8S5]|nr:ribonuclease P protein component [Clostridiaceae bacterium M8S5]